MGKGSTLYKHPHSMNPERNVDKKGWRSNATIRRLHMYKERGPVRNAKGRIIKAASFQSRLTPGTIARVVPDRRWFGNTRLIGQETLQKFQDEMNKAKKDPFTVVLKQSKLPCSLLTSGLNTKKNMCLLDVESYDRTFGKKSQRKRPKLCATDMQDYAERIQKKSNQTPEFETLSNEDCEKFENASPIFRAGTSKRVWNELYKVIDSSDVVLEVLDARNPMETRCRDVERYIKSQKQHKHVVLLLNKVDLIPVKVAKAWIGVLSKEYPTVAFKSSITNPFGKTTLINLLRQFALLHHDRQQISVGMIGLPNVGKSSVINTLRNKKVCNVAPIAGETKVWQYVTLMKRIYLIDCPGIVVQLKTDLDKHEHLVLNGAVRVENLLDPESFVPALLERVKEDHICKTYQLSPNSWTCAQNFLPLLAKRLGRLSKHGKPDCQSAARTLLNDYQRSKLPHFSLPPNFSGDITNITSSLSNEENKFIEQSEQTAEMDVSDGDDKEAGNDTSTEIHELPDDDKQYRDTSMNTANDQIDKALKNEDE
ncbi:hypothetical protein GJ496_009249 [Pomphorhynchus laevis]|nr:hypothetical protein GJ496_009249 [Pomphorhynchus laevis]